MKLPAFMFYTGDWLKDPALRSVSYAARGMWIDMLSLMHESDRRGYLQLNGKPVTIEQLARMTGGSLDEVSRLVQELEECGVCSRSGEGTIYNRRMVRDEQKRRLCSQAGKRGGGNPAFKGEAKGNGNGERKGTYESECANESEIAEDSEEVAIATKGRKDLANGNCLAARAEDAGETAKWVARIAKAHPRYEKPVETQRVIHEQIERMRNETLPCASGGSVASRDGAAFEAKRRTFDESARWLLQRTELYHRMTDAWPPEERRWIVSSAKWFANGCFEEDEKLWQSKGAPATAKASSGATVGVSKGVRDEAECRKCGKKYSYQKRLAEILAGRHATANGYHGLYCRDECHDSDEAVMALERDRRR